MQSGGENGSQELGDPGEKTQDTRGMTTTPSGLFFPLSQDVPPGKAGGKEQK